MSGAKPSPRRLQAAGVAAAGVILGHWLAYRVAFRMPEARHQVLAETGHGYWIFAVKLAVVLAVASVGVVAARRLRTATDSGRAPGERFSALALWLFGIQTAAFVAMEAVERVAAGAPLAGLFDHRVLLLGLAAQLLTASLGALVLLLVTRAADLVALVLRRARFPSPARSTRPRSAPASRVPLLEGAAGVRGPPSL